MFSKLKSYWLAATFAGLSLFGLSSFAVSDTSLIDYATIATSIQGQVTAAIVAAATLVGLIWGAKLGFNFVKRMLGK